MNAREIAILYKYGITEYDKTTLRGETNPVLSSLKKRDGIIVKSDEGYPFKWSVATRY